LKAKLLARAEATTDELLKDERLHEKMTLSEIQVAVGQSEADFRQAALEEIIALQQETPKRCPMCGSELGNKGKSENK
jgi:hypothetical protein